MTLRNLSPRTIDAYIWQVDKFCQYFGKQPEQLDREQIRQYQLYLVNEKQVSWSSFNQAVCGLRFLYQVTLRRPWTVEHIPFGKKPKKLPTVLGDEEVTRLLACLRNHKHRTVLTACYAAGLRLSETTHLKAAHIDSSRMQIRVSNGKGNKERLVPLSPRLAQRTPRILESDPPVQLSFPWQDGGRTAFGHHHSERPAAAGGGRRQDLQDRYSAHDAPQFRHGTLGSGRRLVDDSRRAWTGPQEFHHDVDLPARTASSPGPHAQSVGLATDPAVSAVDRSSPATRTTRPPRHRPLEAVHAGLPRAAFAASSAARPRRAGQAVAVPHGGLGRPRPQPVRSANIAAACTTRVATATARSVREPGGVTGSTRPPSYYCRRSTTFKWSSPCPQSSPV